MPEKTDSVIEVRNLTMKYGHRLIQQDLDFSVVRGSIFVIMGPSGCGKSTLLRHLVGLQQPASGQVMYSGVDFWGCPEEQRNELLRRVGILYQNGGLWSSLTLTENVALPLREFSAMTNEEILEQSHLKLSLVGLGDYGDYYPSEISGGMRKRAGLARALALDPEILFFDEPSAGLDPVSSRRLDELIMELRDSLGATIVMVTHELASIMTVATDSIFLDPVRKTIAGRGDPRVLREQCPEIAVRRFLNRGM